jgi:hypothetical protein
MTSCNLAIGNVLTNNEFHFVIIDKSDFYEVNKICI